MDYVVITRHAAHNWYEAAHVVINGIEGMGRDRVIRLLGTGVESVVSLIEDLLKPKGNGLADAR